MTTYKVANAQELNSALSQVRGGDRIDMATGDYGSLYIRDLHLNAEVVIASANPNAPARFNSVSLWKSDHLTFDGIDVNYKPNASTTEWDSAVRADGSSDISVINSTITGGNAVVGTDPNAAAGTQGNQGIKGQPVGRGMTFNNSQNVTIQDNDVSSFTHGIRVSSVDGLTVSGNDIHHLRKVPLGGGGVDNALVADNHFHDLTPWKFGGLGDHGDYVHFWTVANQSGPSQNITVTGNFFAQGQGVPVLGVFIDNNFNKGFQNVTIKDNVIHNGNAQAMRLEAIDGLTIQDNTLIQASGSRQDAPVVMLVGGNKNVTIDGNIFAGVAGGDMNNPAGKNIVITNNKIVQVHDALSPDYVGKLFVNALASDPSLADLQAIRGSLIDGFGASITWGGGGGVGVPSAPSQSFPGFIGDSHGNGMALGLHSFDLSDPATGKPLPLKGASVSWDFGDGSTGSGAAPNHFYGTPGSYQASATIKLAGGATHVLTRTVDALTPVAINTDFSNGFKDSSPFPLNVVANGNVSFVNDPVHGKGVHLDSAGSTVEFKRAAEILDNPEFTISLGFAKDAGAAGTGGRLLTFAGTAVIDATSNGIVVRAGTSSGDKINLEANGIGVNDTAWHQVAYTYSQATGKAALYVDGALVDSQSGLTGIQQAYAGHGLSLGNPYGRSLSATLDDATFLRGALTASEVGERFAAFQNGQLLDYAQSGAGHAPSPVPTPPPVVTLPPVVVTPPGQDGDQGQGGSQSGGQGQGQGGNQPPAGSGTWHGFEIDPAQPGGNHVLRFDAQVVNTANGPAIHLDGRQDHIVVNSGIDTVASNRLGFSIDFASASPHGYSEKLVWNHERLGLIVRGDGVVLKVGTADEGFKTFEINGLGLDDTAPHKATVLADGNTDQLQLLIDDILVFEELNTDISFDTQGYDRGYTVGVPWVGSFHGDVLDLKMCDQFQFAPNSAFGQAVAVSSDCGLM